MKETDTWKFEKTKNDNKKMLKLNVMIITHLFCYNLGILFTLIILALNNYLCIK